MDFDQVLNFFWFICSVVFFSSFSPHTLFCVGFNKYHSTEPQGYGVVCSMEGRAMMLVTCYSYCLMAGELYYDFSAGQSFSNGRAW